MTEILPPDDLGVPEAIPDDVPHLEVSDESLVADDETTAVEDEIDDAETGR